MYCTKYSKMHDCTLCIIYTLPATFVITHFSCTLLTDLYSVQCICNYVHFVLVCTYLYTYVPHKWHQPVWHLSMVRSTTKLIRDIIIPSINKKTHSLPSLLQQGFSLVIAPETWNNTNNLLCTVCINWPVKCYIWCNKPVILIITFITCVSVEL